MPQIDAIERWDRIKDRVSNIFVKDFPLPGVNFLDIFPLMQKYYPEDFRSAAIEFGEIVFAAESRAFLFYSEIGPDRCVPIRKAGKLPGTADTLVSYVSQKEYGKDTMEFSLRHIDKWITGEPRTIEVTFFDDVLATGGTAEAFINKINSLEYKGFRFHCSSCAFYTGLSFLRGRERLEALGIKVSTVYEV